MEDVFIPIMLFGSIAVVFSLWFYFKYKARLATQETFRLALEKGNELSPDFMKQMAEPEPSSDRDLRRGLIWLAIGFAIAITGVAMNQPDAIGPTLGGASFPGLIGVAYLIMWRFGARKA